MGRAQKRSKEWGYEVETQFLKRLREFFPNLKRVGSMGYSKAHADLVQEGKKWDGLEAIFNHPVRIVAHRDKRRTPLVTLSVDDLEWLIDTPTSLADVPVVVQCKGRKTSTIGTLYQELKEATR